MSQPAVRRRPDASRPRRCPEASGRLELGPDDVPFPLLTRPSVDVTVQLLSEDLARGRVPRVAVGDVVEAAPAIHLASCRPCYVGGDRWSTDEHGRVRARGTILGRHPSARPSGHDLLEVAGRAYPLTWAEVLVDDVGLDHVDVEGVLHLDPEPVPGADLDAAVALCRRRWRVEALRRYRLRRSGVLGSPASLPRVPEPGEVGGEAVYVADLSPAPRAAHSI